jgi:type III restriction enzyme
LRLDATDIPPEVQLKGMLPDEKGRPSLMGPGRLETIDLQAFRRDHRVQELAFDMSRDLVRRLSACADHSVPVHALFPQVLRIVDRYLREKVRPTASTHRVDVFLAPYYGWVLEVLVQAIRPDAKSGEAPELPLYEQNRDAGSTADVTFWTGKDVRSVVKSHLNYVVADTQRWEQTAAYFLDTHRRVSSFVKNDHLGFAIPYLHNGQPHDYVPDFLVRLVDKPDFTLIVETKGYDRLKDVKQQAAQRWVAAVNADEKYGTWSYVMTTEMTSIPSILDAAGR